MSLCLENAGIADALHMSVFTRVLGIWTEVFTFAQPEFSPRGVSPALLQLFYPATVEDFLLTPLIFSFCKNRHSL